MQHPFSQLEQEYNDLWHSMQIVRQADIDAAARRLLGFKSRYSAVSGKTGVPIVVMATIHNRESDANFKTNLGQGDPLTGPSTHVPKGRPPLLPGMTFPVTWEYAAEDALHIDRLDAVTNWSTARALYEQELYNGFGPRNRGIYTGYLWAGTNHYTKGKFVADGKFDPNAVDKQLGTAPIMKRMIELDASLALPGTSPAGSPAASNGPAATPVGVGGGALDTASLQEALNKCGADPQLLVDGNFGRATRAAVSAFQESAGLEVDGIAGPQTIAALEKKPATR